ncbi:NAD-dependent epimerase/dehydratase family protein [Micromonospora avicenniae]|uniref:NAD-dependent epimerase/dehydratase family protein n=1 Tax=Micromonospora avicenniae TaxID=1198245 RepID=UPI003320B797
MRVLVAGASGVLGRHMSMALADAGHDVIGMTRSPAGTEQLGRMGIEPLVADLMDRDALLHAVDGLQADAAIHAATALRKVPMRHQDMAATNALRVQGTRNLIEAVQSIGARRLIVESMHFGYGYGDFGDRTITETNTPFAPPGRTSALERHLQGFRVKEHLALHTDGVDGISLRFGALYGPGFGAGGTDQIVTMLRKRRLPVVPDRRPGLLPWTHLADAGAATVAALERGTPGQAYHIVDDEPASMNAHVRFLAAAFGTPKPMTVPLSLVRVIGPYLHVFLTSVARLSNDKAKRELGWTPAYPTYRDGIRSLATS